MKSISSKPNTKRRSVKHDSASGTKGSSESPSAPLRGHANAWKLQVAKRLKRKCTKAVGEVYPNIRTVQAIGGPWGLYRRADEDLQANEPQTPAVPRGWDWKAVYL